MNSLMLPWKRYAASLMLLLALGACQDDQEELAVESNSQQIATTDRTALSLDSLFLYAKDIYLWNESLPDYNTFSPRKYTNKGSEEDNLEAALYAISQYSLNPATGRAFEFVSDTDQYPKYSFISENSPAGGSLGVQASSAMSELDGSTTDFGFSLSSVAADDIRLRYVSSGSPAALAGLSRGDKLLKVGNRSVRADSQADIDLILSTFDGDSYPLTVQKPNGTQVEATLKKTTYTVNPVYKSTVLKAGEKKVGYLAYSMFSSVSNSKAVLEKAFANFAAAGATDLIIDFRYNGGGYVATAELICNQIAPASLNGKVMYQEVFNKQMQQGKAGILENQKILDADGKPIPYQGRVATYADMDYSVEGNTFNFAPEGPLETVKNVYFIIGEATASASELVINALKPHMNVTLIGANSFGKPVGFFAIQIDKYEVFMSLFSTVNANGEGNYYGGFAPDVPAEDDVTHDFGDPAEASIAAALHLIAPGSTTTARAYPGNAEGLSVKAPKLQLKHIGERPAHHGLIENRRGSALK